MPLHLTIENETSLPDGGPISCTVTRRRGIDIGRDQYLDWVLPDPTRGISGKHCEIRFRDGRYWLNDVSTNGTFVNRSEFRLSQPHALSHGDRIEIGPFIIAVAIEPDEDGQTAGTSSAAAPAGGYADNQLWSVGEAAPAINPRELRAPVVAAGIGSQDVLDWAVNLPPVDARYTPSPLPYDPPPQPQPPAALAPEPLDWAMPQPNRPIRRAEPEPQYAAPEPVQPAPPPMPAPMEPPPTAAMSPAAMPPAIPVAMQPALGMPAPEPARGGFVWDIEKEADLPPVPMRAAGEGTAPPAMMANPGATAAPPLQAAPERPASTPPASMAAAPPPRLPPADMRPMQPQMADPQPSLAAYAAPAAVAPTPTPYAPPAAAYAGNSDALIQRFALAAGIPPELMRSQDAGQLMDMLGTLTRITADSLRQLQTARAQSKGVMRSANHTVIEATGNNPLRFSPTTEDALKIMFGPRTSGYLPAADALEQSFTDLKKHQMLLFTAMQTALKTLMSDLAPEKIEAAVGDDKGLGALLTSRKAKLWERYETQWKAKVGNNEQGMLGVFMLLFADAYDKSS